jgi:S-adenosylmethionine decarboxylase proenzyme
MFEEIQSSGKHMICDIRNIQNTDLLNDLEGLKNMMKQICSDFSFNILGEIQHLFTPQGCSIILLLSESHMTVHTFPERKYIAFDIYTCRQYEDDSEYIKIHDFLMEQLKGGDKSSCHIVDREF